MTKNTEQASNSEIKVYQQEVGSLLYLSTRTRPEITFVVNHYARFMLNPNKSHFQALNYIWKYLNNLGPKGLIFSPNKIDQSPPLVGYSDAD